MLPDERILIGVAGTTVSAMGASMSVTELQAIISIIITVLGFIISVLVPGIIKIVKKIKKAKEDGVITKEEKEDIISTGKEIVDETQKFIEEQKKEEGKKIFDKAEITEIKEYKHKKK